MKFLRILIMAVCLNVPFAYGMDQSNMLQTIKSATKFAVVSVLFIDGARAALTGESLLPIPKIENHAYLNGALHKLVGCGEMVLSLRVINL
jgi:hypothetical protein